MGRFAASDPRLCDGRNTPVSSDLGSDRAARKMLLASAPTERRSRLFNDWLSFAIYGLFALAIPTTMVIGSFVFAQRPSRRTSARTIPFESGVSQGPPQHQRFTVSFYLTAMLFILFDIEIVFLYPLAVILHELSWFGFFEFLTFLVILLVAYVYIWRKGALEWH
jgi:NADH-quinone oxidoreductase subunit A